MRPSFLLAALSVLSTTFPLHAATEEAERASLAADCKPFFEAAAKPPVHSMMMHMPGMQMLDAASGPLPLVCLTMNDPFRPPQFNGIGTPSIDIRQEPTIQGYFDQGLRFYMGFNNRESYRAFRYAAVTAASSGKPCAWCYWGAAVPLGTDINMSTELEADRLAANDYLAKARALRPTGLLAALIEATAKRSVDCPSGESTQACRDRRSRGYYDAMVAIKQANPHDPNVGVLFVDSILNLTPWHLPAKDKFELGRDTLEMLMGSYPSHNGLIHWYIHLMELSDDPGRASAAAGQLARLAPNAGHLVHMPSHIYYRTGDMQGAIDSNIAASNADEAYFNDPKNKLEHPDGDRYRYGYYPHTLHFLAAAATLQGSKDGVEYATKRLYAAPPPDAEGYRKDKYREVYYLAKVVFASPAEIRAFVKPDAASHIQPRGNAAYAYAQVMADIWDGKTPTDTLAKFETEVRNYPGIGNDPDKACRASIPANGDTGLCMVAIENHLVRGRIAASKKDWATALASTQQAVDLQTALSYDEPPDWLHSLHQTHAAMLIRKAFADGPFSPASQELLRQAKVELVASLDPHNNRSDVFPGNGWAYFGLWQIAQSLKGDDPAKAWQAFSAHWTGTTPSLDRM